MPPKRKQPAAAASASAPKPTAKRRSKLAKDNNITADEEEEIREAFSLFAQNQSKDSKEGEIATGDVRRAELQRRQAREVLALLMEREEGRSGE